MDLKEKITQISANTVQRVKGPDLEDNQKRWLVIGICLHTVLSPALQKYVSSCMDTLFHRLNNVHNIDQQTYPPVLMRYPPGRTVLNYDAVNNNVSIPTALRRQKPERLDYKIQNPLDLSKLFLATNMTQYTGFDDSCDLSALLGILAQSDLTAVGTTANQIRSNVRNPWAHCSFDDWDTTKYLSSFQQINDLLEQLNLPADQLTLSEWETKGFTLLNGRSVAFDLLTEMNEKTSALAQYVLQNENDSVKSEEKINALLNNIAFEMKDSLRNAENEIKKLREEVIYIREEQYHTKIANIATKIEISDIKSEMQNKKCDINDMKPYLLHQRPYGKPFFYPPDRLECFVGRDYILSQLQTVFMNEQHQHHTEVISGLGGSGKTAVAIEYAWMFQGSFPGGVFWLSAESDEAIEDTVNNLAIDINVTGNTSKETFQKTLSWLSSLTRKWLLVIDNADSEHISSYMKQLLFGAWRRNTKGCILVTTRRELIEVEESFKIKCSNCHELKCLSDEEGVLFVSKRSGREVDHKEEEHVFKLVYELGGLPLALEQAAAQIKRINCTYADYLIRFRKIRLNLFKKPLIPFSDSERQRYAITTTWELNLEKICLEAEQEGLGNTPVLLMQVSAFLHADDIPLSIFNEGEPAIADDADALSDPLEIKRSVEILTRFSLFQRARTKGLSVHRLVQEVIRNKIKSDERSQIILSAVRMLNKAIQLTSTPLNVIKAWKKSGKIDRGSLYLWSKLAVHSNVIKQNALSYSQNEDEIFHSLEMAKLMHNSAIFNSFQNRQDIALSDKAKMFSIIAALHIGEHAIVDLLELTIPLHIKDRQCVRESIATVLKTEELALQVDHSGTPLSPTVLREMGNKACKEQRYEDAIQYYTEALRACRTGDDDPRLYLNRSIVYFKIKRFSQALNDANFCIDIDPSNVKGHILKAYAIAELIETGDINPEMEGAGLSSVSIAAVLDEKTLIHRKMKIYYPIACYQIIDPTFSLGGLMMDMSSARPFTTYVLKKGRYSFSSPVKSYKSCQVVGMEDGVYLDTGKEFLVEAPTKEEFDFNFQMEENITIHFENVSFVSDGNINVGLNGIAAFYRCKFSNGKCPENRTNFCAMDSTSTLTMPKEGINKSSYSAITGRHGSKVTLNTCNFDSCKGFSIFVEGQKSLLYISHCKIIKSGCSGVVVQNGATLQTINSEISDNGLYGIEIGHDCSVIIHGNTIDGNKMDGAFFGTITNAVKDTGKTIKATIRDNSFCNNGLSGIVLNTGSFEIKDNKVTHNWARGILLQNYSSANIQNNEISANRCGGIRIGRNYSATVYVDGNTIKDHNGPDIDIRCVDKEFTRYAVVTKQNILDQFKKQFVAPRVTFTYCCSCKRCYENLKSCNNCKVTKYCSKECQKTHWPEHKKICRILGQYCTIDLQLSKVKTVKGTSLEPKYFERFFSKSSRMIMQVESDHNYEPYDTEKILSLYTLDRTLSVRVMNEHLYNLCSECGTLQEDTIVTKTLRCYASLRRDLKVLSVLTTEFPSSSDTNST